MFTTATQGGLRLQFVGGLTNFCFLRLMCIDSPDVWFK